MLPWDHPSRAVTNTVSIIRKPHLGTLFDARQRGWIREIYRTTASAEGRRALHNTITLEGKLEGNTFTIYTDAEPGRIAHAYAQGRAQVVINGGHLMLRSGAADALGGGFGGAIAYGQQIGNGRYRVAGNAFAPHGDAANRVFAALDDAQRARALHAEAPHEALQQLQGAGGAFDGVRIGTLEPEARERTAELVSRVLATYPESAQRAAWRALETHGGVDALHLAFYESKGFYADGRCHADLAAPERARNIAAAAAAEGSDTPYWQVWRIEGPGCVMHFQGHPHVHAYVHVAEDLAAQHVGETIAEAPRALSPGATRALALAALRSETGADAAFLPGPSPARLLSGPVRESQVYAMSPFDEAAVVATFEPRQFGPALREGLAAQGVDLSRRERVRIATSGYALAEADLGEPETVQSRGSIRDVYAAHLRASPPSELAAYAEVDHG